MTVRSAIHFLGTICAVILWNAAFEIPRNVSIAQTCEDICAEAERNSGLMTWDRWGTPMGQVENVLPLIEACNRCRNQPTQQYVPQEPAGNVCGDGLTCPAGTYCSGNPARCILDGQIDCVTYTCAVGMRCASSHALCLSAGDIECGDHICRNGYYCGKDEHCIPEGAKDCGSGVWCYSGKKCSRDGKQCIEQDVVECNGYTCASGKKCGSQGQCLERDSVDCGDGRSCGAGYVCRVSGGCATREELAAERAAEEERKRQEAERRKAELEAKREQARQAAVERQRQAAEKRQQELELARLREQERLAAAQRALAEKVTSYCVSTAEWQLRSLAYPGVSPGRLCAGQTPQSSVPDTGSVAARQAAAIGVTAPPARLQLNQNLYTDIASTPVLRPPTAGGFGSATYIPAFTTEHLGGCQTFNTRDASLDTFGCPRPSLTSPAVPAAVPSNSRAREPDRNPFNYQAPLAPEQRNAQAEASAAKFRTASLRTLSDIEECGWPTSCHNYSDSGFQGLYVGKKCTVCKRQEICDLNSFSGKMDNCSEEKYDCKTTCRPLFR